MDDASDDGDSVSECDSYTKGSAVFSQSCDQIRSKITNLIKNGGMKVGDFQRAINVSSTAYHKFMGRKGKWEGENTDAFMSALSFFEDREERGVKEPTQKRVKKDEEKKKLDVSEVTLDGEGTGDVPIFDSCDEVRRKINAHLRDPNVTKAGFTREMKKGLVEGTALQAKSIDDFLRKKGPVAGNQSRAYYAAYVFFEKERIQKGKAKSKHRQEMEKEWPTGVDTSRPRDRFWVCTTKERRPYMNKYGGVTFQ